MDERDSHIIEAYAVIQHTIKSRGGPCGKLVSFMEDKLKFEREDLIQMVAVDYCQYYKDDYNPELSSINTFVNKFIKWRLMSYVRETNWGKRAMIKHEVSWDQLKEDYGDDIRHSMIARNGKDDTYWESFSKLIEETR